MVLRVQNNYQLDYRKIILIELNKNRMKITTSI